MNLSTKIAIGTLSVFIAAAVSIGAAIAAPASSPGITGMARPTGIAVDPAGKIYVANSSGNTVTVYAADSNGSVPPLATIGGPHTGLSAPNGVALDSLWNVYVANMPSPANRGGSIAVYSPGVSGDAAPFATIAGPNTELANPQGVALDSSGNIYVANAIGGPSGAGSITVYSAHSNGDAAPIATIAGPRTRLNLPGGIAFDSAGNIYVANTGARAPERGSITVYRAAANGNVAPIATIFGPNTGLHSPEGIAADSSGKIYVANFNVNSVTAYAAGASGDAAPIATIVGASTGLAEPTGIALDSAGDIYVTNQGRLPSAGPYTVTVYSSGATGDTAPIATIGGD
ncbi:MAG: NHL repeat-containing protein [Candidatus Binataceae bacterium]